MKRICINTKGTEPGFLIEGQEYDLKELYYGRGLYSVNDTPVSLDNFESLVTTLLRFSETSPKMILTKPTRGVTVDILLTDSYIIVYSHTKGSHSNIFGNHYRYYHNNNTGEFIPEHLTTKEPVLLKQRLLMADFNKIEKNIIAQRSKAIQKP